MKRKFIIIFIFFTIFINFAFGQIKYIEITQDNINIHVNPDNCSTIVGQVKKGDIFKYIEERNGWSSIIMFSGKSRYVYQSLTKEIYYNVSLPEVFICSEISKLIAIIKNSATNMADNKYPKYIIENKEKNEIYYYFLVDKHILNLFHLCSVQPVDYSKIIAKGILKNTNEFSTNLEFNENVKADRVIVEVNLESIDLIYNNHVGNDWAVYSEINGIQISKNKKFSEVFSKKGVTLEIFAQALEYDKVTDIGSNKKYISLSSIDIGKVKFVELDVIVRENRGRYSGNTAKWRFTYRINIMPSN